jgi:hypothetical protein
MPLPPHKVIDMRETLFIKKEDSLAGIFRDAHKSGRLFFILTVCLRGSCERFYR